MLLKSVYFVALYKLKVTCGYLAFNVVEIGWFWCERIDGKYMEKVEIWIHINAQSQKTKQKRLVISHKPFL
jgi:hypothetical protein